MFIARMIQEKRQWRQYKTRTSQLPADYSAAVDAVERYLMYSGWITKGDIMMTMLEDLADLFEQSAANGTPIRDVVGADPVEFAETFLQNYARGQWVNTERERLTKAIDLAIGEDPARDKGGHQ